jgi:L-histidine Nalpha-methyltransferase
MKILILASDTSKTLNLDHEIRDLRGVIDKSPNRENFQVVDALAVRVDDLQELFLRHKPQIVHFCGHGDGEQGLVFENEVGQPKLVSTQGIAGLFKLVSDQVKCVLLNACYTDKQINSIVQHIDYVIGMKYQIRDDSAIAFSKGFYRALGYGWDIDRAYDLGCNSIQLLINRSDIPAQQRKLTPIDIVKQTKIPESQQPTLMINKNLQSSQELSQKSKQKPDNKILSEIRKDLEVEELDLDNNSRSLSSQSEEISDFLNRLMDDYFNQSNLKWTLCFTGEDQSNKLAELTEDLRNDYSSTGNGKRIPSGFSYWGIVSTIAWETTCNDQLYPVMRESIRSFIERWNQIPDESVTLQLYHYVSLGVGTGEKDNHILKRIHKSHNNIRYFPIDMSSVMLRLGVQKATREIPLKGSHILPIQIDFSTTRNVAELRKLLDEVDNGDPLLFSLLGNTLANFHYDSQLLKNIAALMRHDDKLLLEVATTSDLNEKVASTAAREYSITSFKKFVASALLQFTDLHINYDSICFESSIEPDHKAIYIKVLYRNLTGETISVRLPDRETVNFDNGDTIRLYTTRKYSSYGIQTIISDSNLEILNTIKSSTGEHKNFNFGMDLILLQKVR